MKKILLLILVFGVGYATIAQQAYKFRIDAKEKTEIKAKTIGIEPVKSDAITKSHVEQKIVTPPADRNTDIVTVVPIGTSANAYSYGYAGGQRSIIWADPMLNTITHFHRMGGALDPGGYSGDLGYDVSTDGGATWTNQVEVYVAEDNAGGEYYFDSGRYPSHGLYNPSGSLDDARVVFFAAALDATNSDTDSGWGGYAFGTGLLSDTSVHTRFNLTSEGDVYREVPEGYEMSDMGVSYGLGLNEDWTSGTLVYQQQLILDKGVWSDDEEDFVYTEMLIDAECTDDLVAPSNHKIAFGADGMTGYIALLSDNGEAEQLSGFLNVYPLFLKTEDGGETWTEQQFIQLDGPDGIGGIVYHHLTDEQIAELFEAPVPSREEISYTTAFDFDIAVDMNNNLHIAVVIAPTGSDPHSIVTAEGYLGAYDIFTDDGGTTWYAEEMGRPRTFRGTFGDLTEDNRIQITTNYDRDRFFITWLDTDLEDEEDNNRPNIWCRGFNPGNYMKTADASGADAPSNVTNFSAGMWQAYMGTAAQMALEIDRGSYLIPMTWQEMDPTDVLSPVQYQYITDFVFTDADFTVQGIGEEQEIVNNLGDVTQNYPNPFNGVSYVTINLTEGADLSLEIYTITGQLVSSEQYGYTPKGKRTLTINGSNLASGVYFYTVKAGGSKVTHKMIVE